MVNFNWRGIFISNSIRRQVRSLKFRSTVHVNVHSRRSTILSNYLKHVVYIHNGKRYKRVRITKWMIGHKFGEFSFTKHLGPNIHESKRNIKRRAKLKRKKGKK